MAGNGQRTDRHVVFLILFFQISFFLKFFFSPLFAAHAAISKRVTNVRCRCRGTSMRPTTCSRGGWTARCWMPASPGLGWRSRQQ